MPIRLLIFSLVTIFIFENRVLAQCDFDNNYYTWLSPSCPGSETAFCMYGGEYVEVDVVEGIEYTFSTCGG
ncbi:MAG: hypothetical protein R2809_15375, partial [Flavobacteriales bacterium]